jgi:hypothetical protein
MLTKKPALNFAIFLLLLSAFFWIVYEFSNMPLVVGIAGLVLVFFLTAVWIPYARKKMKKKQKPGDLGGHPNEWQ